MDYNSVVQDWQQNAESNDRKNYEFLRSMKFEDYGFAPDDLATELHKRAFQIVDCTRCASCCKTMDIVFDESDIERIAGHLDIKVDEFIDMYLERDDVERSYIARQNPCPFLGEDDCCTIYDVRPTICQEYSHTNKEGFTFRTRGVSSNALASPAVFWIVEQMKQKALE